MKTQLAGKRAEELARNYLENRGLNWITNNFSCPFGEIDIIMRDGDCIVFVEVRYRSRSDYGGARESVDARKQKKLVRTANWYLKTHHLLHSVARIDVVAISALTAVDDSFEWIKNAVGD